MKIFLDIGHPAHVHYFCHFVKKMEGLGHRFFITARKRQHVGELLDSYNIPYVNRGRGGSTVAGKIFYLIRMVFLQYLRARKFQPDLFLDFSTIYSGPAAWLLKKPYITFTDTENTRTYRRLIQPFCSAVYTPMCFKDSLGKGHVRFNGLMEMASIAGFVPDSKVLGLLGVEEGEPFVVVRFVDWNALHDKGKKGFVEAKKIELVQRLSTRGKVFICSEGPLPDVLNPYKLEIPASMIYHVLFYAALFVGESATMASESALLGTPSVFVSDFKLGYLQYLETTHGLVHNFGSSIKEQQAAINMCETFLSNPQYKKEALKCALEISENFPDVTAFMIQVAEKWGTGSGKNKCC